MTYFSPAAAAADRMEREDRERQLAELTRLREANATLYGAVSHFLDQTQQHPDIRYYAGKGTTLFALAARAEAMHLDEPIKAVVARRQKRQFPPTGRQEPEVELLRVQLDHYQRG